MTTPISTTQWPVAPNDRGALPRKEKPKPTRRKQSRADYLRAFRALAAESPDGTFTQVEVRDYLRMNSTPSSVFTTYLRKGLLVRKRPGRYTIADETTTTATTTATTKPFEAGDLVEVLGDTKLNGEQFYVLKNLTDDRIVLGTVAS
jgi:hypothetical protein